MDPVGSGGVCRVWNMRLDETWVMDVFDLVYPLSYQFLQGVNESESSSYSEDTKMKVY